LRTVAEKEYFDLTKRKRGKNRETFMIKNFIASALHLKVVNQNIGHDGWDIGTPRDMGNAKGVCNFCRK
jgi:hypothetical protein